jgi:hypothetical protein
MTGMPEVCARAGPAAIATAAAVISAAARDTGLFACILLVERI